MTELSPGTLFLSGKIDTSLPMSVMFTQDDVARYFSFLGESVDKGNLVEILNFTCTPSF